MAKTEAQKRANKKYRDTKTVRKNIDMIIGKDDDIMEHISNLEIPFSTYIKELIREDIEKSNKQ